MGGSLCTVRELDRKAQNYFSHSRIRNENSNTPATRLEVRKHYSTYKLRTKLQMHAYRGTPLNSLSIALVYIQLRSFGSADPAFQAIGNPNRNFMLGRSADTNSVRMSIPLGGCF